MSGGFFIGRKSMAQLEVVLAYSGDSMGRESASVPIGRTSDPGLLRALRDRLISEAEGEARMWQGVDPVLGEMAATEAERLERILAFFLPDEPAGPGLKLVKDE
jgi:hypothetical protein